MRNDDRKISGGEGWLAVPRPGRGNSGILPTSFKALSGYLRIVSSDASTVRSAASGISDRDSESVDFQVNWTGFDKLEDAGGITQQVLLLGYSDGFQVLDVEETANMLNLVSKHDGPVSFMQMLPKPMASKQSGDKFADSCLLLIICADGSFSGGNNNQVRYIVFNAVTLEREYTTLTNPFVMGSSGSGNIGFGPLAVGPRWMAYSGTQVEILDSRRASPQHLTYSASSLNPASNESLVSHFSKESGKKLAAGIVTLGDMGYKKLSRYYSELVVPDGSISLSGTARGKAKCVDSPDAHDVGMVQNMLLKCISFGCTPFA
ncbi:Hypothetical predicted protein [Olea europaea subsp. europaea]|uniref:BCAS3 WD40 domain-containing protein n=1 Tax=Olea europaea subsp. europaea TaxID=158383 RepID=A0A8S0RM45_OLEEU|nr:Hypothetical predicted protein [Olea europaea subsp. europaea]